MEKAPIKFQQNVAIFSKQRFLGRVRFYAKIPAWKLITTLIHVKIHFWKGIAFNCKCVSYLIGCKKEKKSNQHSLPTTFIQRPLEKSKSLVSLFIFFFFLLLFFLFLFFETKWNLHQATCVWWARKQAQKTRKWKVFLSRKAGVISSYNFMRCYNKAHLIPNFPQ